MTQSALSRVIHQRTATGAGGRSLIGPDAPAGPVCVVHRASRARIKIEAEARQAWLQGALKLRYPDPRHVPAWRAFVHASVALAQEHLSGSAAAALRDFFLPDGPDALVFENLPA